MARKDNDDSGTRTGDAAYPPSRSTGGTDATSRLSAGGRHADDDRDSDRTDTGRTDSGRTDSVRNDTGRADTARTGTVGATETDDEYESRMRPAKYKAAKTSAAATFALVFGLAALFCALTAILSLPALVFALIGIILGIVGIKKAKLPGVTGKGVAIGGLVTAVLGLLLGGAVLAGAAVFLNDEANLDRLQTEIDNLRENAPSGSEIVDEVPGG